MLWVFLISWGLFAGIFILFLICISLFTKRALKKQKILDKKLLIIIAILIVMILMYSVVYFTNGFGSSSPGPIYDENGRLLQSGC